MAAATGVPRAAVRSVPWKYCAAWGGRCTMIRSSFLATATSTPAPASTSLSAAATVMESDCLRTEMAPDSRSPAYTKWTFAARPICCSAALRVISRMSSEILRLSAGIWAGSTTTGSRDGSTNTRRNRGPCSVMAGAIACAAASEGTAARSAVATSTRLARDALTSAST